MVFLPGARPAAAPRSSSIPAGTCETHSARRTTRGIRRIHHGPVRRSRASHKQQQQGSRPQLRTPRSAISRQPAAPPKRERSCGRASVSSISAAVLVRARSRSPSALALSERCWALTFQRRCWRRAAERLPRENARSSETLKHALEPEIARLPDH